MTVLEKPKVFLSYSWSSTQHKDKVKEWADRLILDGIEVTIDIYDLKEGHDKNAFMEKMVSDDEISHVLIVCDAPYVEKADSRTAGVGTESQIISNEVFKKIEQSKFIPILVDFIDNEPLLPVYLSGRMGIDFSTPQKINENWSRLVRLIYGQPEFQKPQIGSKPSYLEDTAPNISAAKIKFEGFKNSTLHNSSLIRLTRDDFLESCFTAISNLLVKEEPNPRFAAQNIIGIYEKLIDIRNSIIDWVMFQSNIDDIESTNQDVFDLFERLLSVCDKPFEVTSWSEIWYDSHRIFLYETFLYTIAALLKNRRDDIVNTILSGHFLNPDDRSGGNFPFYNFSEFRVHCDELHKVLKPNERSNYHSPVMELIKRNANRTDITFHEIIEADAICLFYAFTTSSLHWYPDTFYYRRHFSDIPFFIKAMRKKDFNRLEVVTDIIGRDKMVTKAIGGMERLNVSQWHDLNRYDGFAGIFKLEQLGTI